MCETSKALLCTRAPACTGAADIWFCKSLGLYGFGLAGQMSVQNPTYGCMSRRPLSAFIGRRPYPTLVRKRKNGFVLVGLRQVFRRPVFRNKGIPQKAFVLRVATIFHQRIKYKHMNHKKSLPAILAAFCLPAWADTPPPSRAPSLSCASRTAQPQRSDDSKAPWPKRHRRKAAWCRLR